MALAREALSELAAVIRQLRTKRGMNQDELGDLTGYSQRRVSLVEYNKARPSQGVMLRLITALEISQREGNRLLNLAGYPEVMSRENRSDAADYPVDVFDHMLTGMEPFPACLLDSHYRVVRLNRPFAELARPLADHTHLFDGTYLEWSQGIFVADDRLKIGNRKAYLYSMVQTLHRLRLKTPEVANPMLRQIFSLPSIPQSWRDLDDSAPNPGDVPVTMDVAGTRAAFTLKSFSVRLLDSHIWDMKSEVFLGVSWPSDDEARQAFIKSFKDVKDVPVAEKFEPLLAKSAV